MAVALALRTGIAHTVWLDDPRAMWTAVDLLPKPKSSRRGRRG